MLPCGGWEDPTLFFTPLRLPAFQTSTPGNATLLVPSGDTLPPPPLRACVRACVREGAGGGAGLMCECEWERVHELPTKTTNSAAFVRGVRASYRCHYISSRRRWDYGE